MVNTWEQPILQLAKPQKNYYTVLIGVKNFQSNICLNNISDISFRVYEYENGERNELYDELEETQLIEALDFEVEWFQIATVKEQKGDIPIAYKDISCNSLEDELITKTVSNIDGVYSLYNIEDTSKSIMHIITNDISWSIGYISPSLIQMYRVLSINSGRIYSLLTGELSKSFSCIFKFNRQYKTISSYTLDEIGEDTDIIINEENLLKSWEKSSSKDKLFTQMRVTGGNSTSGIIFDIRKVNFGSDTISNYDYFKPRMSSALQTALNNWESAIETNTASYNTNLALLKVYYSDLNTLNTAMNSIKEQISEQEAIMNISLKLHYGNPPSSSDSDYTNYYNAINQLVTLNTQKANKQTEINSKNSQINSLNSILNTIGSNVDRSNFFTSDLLNELDCFTYVGDDYNDPTFLSSDETTSEQEIQMALELKANAEKELNITCKPQPEFKATLKNLWSLRDEKDCVISYDAYREKFKLGNLVTIILSDNSWTVVRIIQIKMDYDNPENAEITFSSRTRLDNSTFNLSEIQAQASRAYSSIEMNKYGMNQAIGQTSYNEAFRTGVLNNTLNKMISDDNAQVESGSFGIKLRPWIESEKAYGLSGMWLNPYRMIFTEDGFLHANSAFGLLTLPDNSQRMGINTEYLIGKILITENTYIENESGNYSFDKNGFIASATLGENSYSVGINPSIPSDLFNIKVNGQNKFSIDTVNNRINAELWINAIGGTLGSLTVTGTLSGGYINGSSITVNNGLNTVSINPISGIELLKGSNKTLYFDTDGNAVFTGNISGSVITGTTIKSVFGTTNTITMELSDTSFSTYRTVDGIRDFSGNFTFQAIEFMTPYPNYHSSILSYEGITIEDSYGYIFAVSDSAIVYKGNALLHTGTSGVSYNYSTGMYNFVPAPHITMHDDRYQLKGNYQPLGDYVTSSTFNSAISGLWEYIYAM